MFTRLGESADAQRVFAGIIRASKKQNKVRSVEQRFVESVYVTPRKYEERIKAGIAMGGAPSRALGSSGGEIEQNKKVDDAKDESSLGRATSPVVVKVVQSVQSSVTIDGSRNDERKAKMAQEREESETTVQKINEVDEEDVTQTDNGGTCTASQEGEKSDERQASLLDDIEEAMASDEATRSRSKRYIIDAPLRETPANYRYDANGKLRKVLWVERVSFWLVAITRERETRCQNRDSNQTSGVRILIYSHRYIIARRKYVVIRVHSS